MRLTVLTVLVLVLVYHETPKHRQVSILAFLLRKHGLLNERSTLRALVDDIAGPRASFLVEDGVEHGWYRCWS